MPGNVLTANATLANVNDAVTIGPLQDQNCVNVKLLGNFTGTVVCEVDNAATGNWSPALFGTYAQTTAGVTSLAVTGNEALFMNPNGATWVRFRVSAATSGSAAASARATNAMARAFTV